MDETYAANIARSGSYRHQAAGYRAFIPAPLPPEPPVRLSGDLHTLLSQADRAIGSLDGNGRVGRLLITFLLTEGEVLYKPVLYLSHYFKRRRQTYYDRLQAVRDNGDWEGWLAFFLRGVAEVSAEATEMARRILALREEHCAAITSSLGRAAGNGHRILESLFDRPIVPVKKVQEVIGTTFAAANTLVVRLADLGVLEEITGYARNRRFRYEPYVRLFSDEPAEPAG